MKDSKTLWKISFQKSLPVFFSYIFLGAAYGILMNEAGFAWYWSAVISLFIYTGAYQFVLITFLSAMTPIPTVVLTALLMSSRQTFYSLTFLKDFNEMGKLKWFMVHTLTDESYALDCTLADDENKHELMWRMALECWMYWFAGTMLGALLGGLLTFDTTGIDFCMTALFVIIMIDQWEAAKDHKPAVIGILAGVISLAIIGKDGFILPALLISCIALLLNRKRMEESV